MERPPRELEPKDLISLLSISEGWYCEYKVVLGKPNAIAKSVSALANTHGGWIFYGVEEDRATRCVRRAPGIALTDIGQAETWLRQALSGCLSPAPYYEHAVVHGPIAELELDEEHGILAVFVPEGVNAPYLHSSGRIYRRVADESDPREETDRHLLELLMDRSKGHKRRIADTVRALPEKAEEELQFPCIRLFFFTDLWLQNNDRKPLNFKRFKKLMNLGRVTFNNCYTTAYGHIARLTQGNQPGETIFSWHHRAWFEEVTLPLSWFRVPLADLPHPQFQLFELGEWMASNIRDQRLSKNIVLELSSLITSIVSLCEKLESVLDELASSQPVFCKIQLSGIFRTIPFLDLPAYQTFVRTNGFPVCQEKIALAPSGESPEALLRLETWRLDHEETSPESERRERAAVLNAVTIFVETCRCLGLPIEAIGLGDPLEGGMNAAFRDLFAAAERSQKISGQLLKLGL